MNIVRKTTNTSRDTCFPWVTWHIYSFSWVNSRTQAEAKQFDGLNWWLNWRSTFKSALLFVWENARSSPRLVPVVKSVCHGEALSVLATSTAKISTGKDISQVISTLECMKASNLVWQSYKGASGPIRHHRDQAESQLLIWIKTFPWWTCTALLKTVHSRSEGSPCFLERIFLLWDTSNIF